MITSYFATLRIKIRLIHAHHFQESMERSCAIIIQRHYRGHIGRRVAKRWSKLKSTVQAYNALCNCSALTISRMYKGHVARKIAGKLREELTKYIISLREKEIEFEEEEYWDNLKLGKWRKERYESHKNIYMK